MNKAESDSLCSLFEQRGYQAAATLESADVAVLNSCMVRQSAENRVVNKLANLRALKRLRPGMMLALTGCMVNGDNTALRKRFPYVDYFFRPGEAPPWLEGVEAARALPRHAPPAISVPIMQGCNNFCTYCIVPYRRGRERSRPLEEIVCEVRELVGRGAREVTLLGQNVDSYGHDLAERQEMAGLLQKLNEIDGLARIRFLTNHPKDMSPRLIGAMASLNKVCGQLSLPVQAGSNDILRAMRRGYTVEHYLELVAMLREKVPGLALSTDVIVGFPSETEAQFQETFDLLASIRFDTVHIAAYSPRPGTIAAREMADDVPPEEKKRRLQAVEELQEGIATEIHSRLEGKVVEVLVEGRDKGKWQGRTRTDKLVFFTAPGDYFGQLVKVNINKTGPWSLQGTLVE